MAAIQFAELELFNLTLLLSMRDSIARDAMMACSQFGVRENDAKYLASLTTTQILAIVANVGPQALFTPRPDLFSVMQAPLPLAAPLIAARPPVPVQPRANAIGNAIGSAIGSAVPNAGPSAVATALGNANADGTAGQRAPVAFVQR